MGRGTARDCRGPPERLKERKMTQRRLASRRPEGLGVAVALPWLDAMMPAPAGARRRGAARKLRLVCVEMVHGAAGSSSIRYRGRTCGRRPPSATSFDLRAQPSLKSLEPFRDHLLPSSATPTSIRPSPFTASGDPAADHLADRRRVPDIRRIRKQTQGGRCRRRAISLDQLYAAAVRPATRRFPRCSCASSAVDQAGGCGYGYSCVYTDSISWAVGDVGRCR